MRDGVAMLVDDRMRNTGRTRIVAVVVRFRHHTTTWIFAGVVFRSIFEALLRRGIRLRPVLRDDVLADVGVLLFGDRALGNQVPAVVLVGNEAIGIDVIDALLLVRLRRIELAFRA